ncbi:hypothetical protein JIN85_17605 [Luteolibacter pohnpeiensis]|uniref:Uncharacterized protein n=1 Tax=Luteolibacter pohnpeiensis TaxID=454153 RepID=A0A934VXD2_9BACT|nr:hypothetical protein [Luteolibacter pohnpeiensis]MBK1884240.1 hypothetical protein [Luteolibacter pohnpeiensis]
MRRFIAILGITAGGAIASPSARFDAADLIVRDGNHSIRLSDVLDTHPFYKTIHAIQRRGSDFYVVYGTSELSRGWPPKGGYCGCGLESYIRWLHINDGKIIEDQEGRYQSCVKNRDGWAINWKDGKLVWSSEGLEREGDSAPAKIAWVDFTWSYDPQHPERGISEVKTPSKWQPEPPKTEQDVTGNGH